MALLYPIMLDVSDRRIVIIGGGKVALRKARGVVDAGARDVCVIAPQIDPQMPAGVQRVREAYRPEHLASAQLVFAATDDPKINEAIVQECRGRGVLVCRADADEDFPGDFATPALHRDGSLTVTVSTSGSAALSAAVRDAIARTLDARWARLSDALAELRPMVRQGKLDEAQRRRALRDLASEEAMALVEGGVGALRQWLAARYPGVLSEERARE